MFEAGLGSDGGSTQAARADLAPARSRTREQRGVPETVNTPTPVAQSSTSEQMTIGLEAVDGVGDKGHSLAEHGTQRRREQSGRLRGGRPRR